jgi:hypothetical protein
MSDWIQQAQDIVKYRVLVNTITNVRFHFFTRANVKTTVFWNVALFCLAEIY